jgi:hypothetical protein
MPSYRDMTNDYVVWIPDDRPGLSEIPICSLCGNSGAITIDRLNERFPFKAQMYCLCANGRAHKKWGDGRTIIWSYIPGKDDKKEENK